MSMKVVILAGGRGTRISEESQYRPKPMIEIGGMPIVWHIMKLYFSYGFKEFIICAGYKQEIIKQWFYNYSIYKNDITIDFTNEVNKIVINKDRTEPWKVTIADTGLETMTGGRVKRVKDYIGNEPFMLTYGDAVCDVDISELVKFHNNSKKIATLTAVKIAQQKGILDIDENNSVRSFREKSASDGSLINAGFMVLEPEVFNYIEDDKTILEKDVLEKLASENQLMSYVHEGFWQCMDNIREKEILERLYALGKAPWVKW